jgi:hypothetical protein
MRTDALAKAGCARLFEDTASGAKSDRPGLKGALDLVRKGDVLIVWKLDRSLPHLIETVSQLEARGVGFRSLTSARAVRARSHPRARPRRSRCGSGAGPPRRAQTLAAQGLSVREAAARVKVGKTALYAVLAAVRAGTAEADAATGIP